MQLYQHYILVYVFIQSFCQAIENTLVETTTNRIVESTSFPKDQSTLATEYDENSAFMTTTIDPTCGTNTTCTTMDESNTTLSTFEMNITTMITNFSTSLPPTTPLPNVAHEIYKYASAKTCSCDLQDGICNINCCCDKDCTFEEKLVFQKCTVEENRQYDTSFCKYSEYIYFNNTPYEWDVTQNGLFCIVKANLPKQFSLQKKQYIRTIEDAKLQMTKKHIWKNVDENKTVLAVNTSEYSTYGEPIWILKNKTDIFQLKLPDTFVTTACLGRKKVSYLQNFQTTCVPTSMDGTNIYLSAGNYFENMSVLSSPSFTHGTFLDDNREACPKNVCIPIEPLLCNGNFDDCSSISNDTSIPKAFCNTSISRYQDSCKFLVHKIKYIFYHNGSRGITKANIHIVLQNITYSLHNDLSGFAQEFQVAFHWNNRNYLNYSSERSGNPGYVMGKPILTANLFINESFVNNTKTNKTEMEVHKKIHRNSTTFLDNFFALPYNENGFCVLDDRLYEPVEFGYNFVSKCRIIDQIFLTVQNRSANETCQNITKSIFQFWQVKYKNTTLKLVGNYGNANGNTLEDWTEVLYDFEPYKILNESSGYFTNDNASIICHNITTYLKVIIFHSRSVYEDLLNQEKIIRTMFSFGPLKNINFHINDDKVLIDTTIRSEVMFVDISTQIVKKFADPPTFEIKLPYDFFYPFIKVGNSADLVCNSCLITLSFILACILLFIF